MKRWEHKQLSEICGFQRGLTYAKSDEVDAPGHTVLRANNIDLTSHELDFSELKFISGSVSIPASKIVRPGSLIVCTASGSKAHLGKVAYIDSDYGHAFGGFMGQLTPSKGVDGRYLFYALISPGYKDFIAALSDGVNINNLKFDDLGRYSVPLPPHPEQRRIVAILDEAFEAIATAKSNTQKNLQNSRDVLDGFVAQQLLDGDQTWSAKKLRDLCVVDWGNTNLTKSAYVEGGEFLAVSAAGCDGRIGHREHSAHTPVLSAIGAQCGRMFLPTEDFTAIKNTITLTPRKGICSGPFLYRLLTAIKLPKRGAAQPFMAKGDIQEFVVRTPDSLEKQNLIVDAVDALELESDRLAALLERKLAALDELKKSLLHQAFTGQLTAKSTDQKLEAMA